VTSTTAAPSRSSQPVLTAGASFGAIRRLRITPLYIWSCSLVIADWTALSV
jgi:hypothetical protein